MPGTFFILTAVVAHPSLELSLVWHLHPLFLLLPTVWLTEIRLLLRMVLLEEFLSGCKLRELM